MRKPDRKARQVRLLRPQGVQHLREEPEAQEDRPPLHMQELLVQHIQEKHVQERELSVRVLRAILSFSLQTNPQGMS
jgi:hypothetical protein